jgi:NitT/TauT family transport system ATP-binding protein
VEAIFLADRVAVFSARPGRIKKIFSVNETHPRNRDFMTSSKLGQLRNELYELLHDEIRRTMNLPRPEQSPRGEETFTAEDGGKI